MDEKAKYLVTLLAAMAVACIFVAPSTNLPDTVKSQTSVATTVLLAVYFLLSRADVLNSVRWQPAIDPSISDLLIEERLLRI